MSRKHIRTFSYSDFSRKPPTSFWRKVVAFRFFLSRLKRMSKKVEVVKEVTTLGPKVAEGELVFAVAHIFASFNDTFVHVTDLSGRETLVRVTGGMKARLRRPQVFGNLCNRLARGSTKSEPDIGQRGFRSVAHAEPARSSLAAVVDES